MATYTGDLLIQEDSDGNFDIYFENGQPEMTNGFDTYVLLAVFGEDNWQNGIVKKDSEKMKSGFPGVIRRNVVTDKTKIDGSSAIEKAMIGMITEKMARKVSVDGEIETANRIKWTIDIIGIDNKEYKYFINWQKGSTTAQIVRVA